MQPTIIDHQIVDLSSFETVTKDDTHQLAGLYFFMVLDRLVSVAEWLSQDFFNRPKKYSDLSGPEVQLLAKLRARSGSDELFPSKEQRDQIYVPLFGSAENPSANFPFLRDRLMATASNFAQRQADEGVDALISGFRTALRNFKDLLRQLDGASVRFSRDPVLSNITEQVAYQILRSKGVASAWGFNTPPSNDWPYTDESPASELVDEIYAQMQPDVPGMSARTPGFAEVQEIALRGAEAIATCIDVSASAGEGQIKVLIAKIYTWHVALSPVMQPV